MNRIEERLTVVSYGGGVQSTALLVLAALNEIRHRTFLFANVGDDSEHPETLDYVRNTAVPFGDTHGIAVHELHRFPHRGRRALQIETLRQQIFDDAVPGFPIPMRSESGVPMRRSCTRNFKILTVSKWLKERGARADQPAHVAIGISVDEFERASNRREVASEIIEYPLLDLGLSRDDCAKIIADAGLPVPRKSACYFCPFSTHQHWVDLAANDPELFERAAEVEDVINAGRERPVFLSRAAVPIREAVKVDVGIVSDDMYRCGDVCDT